jgi:hypothetical protein
LPWSAVLGPTRAFGSFSVRIDPAYGGALLVVEAGRDVGAVYLDTDAAALYTYDVTSPAGRRQLAMDGIDAIRVDRTSGDPVGTFTALGPTEVAVGSLVGLRYGFAWKSARGDLERSLWYEAGIPGGIVRVSAFSPTLDVGRRGFVDDATLVRFLPALDALVAGLKL